MEEEYKSIDNLYDYVIENESRVELGVKEGKVIAIRGTLGEKIVTYTSNGFKETINEVGIDPITKKIDWVVTQATGEKMVIKDSKFKQIYKKSDDGSFQYAPFQTKRPIIQVKENIQFIAPWGTNQYLKRDGYLVILGLNNIYGIQNEEFELSYKKLKPLNTSEAKSILKEILLKT